MSAKKNQQASTTAPRAAKPGLPPGREGYKHTKLGWIPEEWEVRRLDGICEKIQDGTHFSPLTSATGDFMYITSRNIRFGYLDLSSVEWVSRNAHEEIFKRCDVRYGDVLLTKDGAKTGNACLNTLEAPFSLLSSAAFLRGRQGIALNGFILNWILSSRGQWTIRDAMAGQAITRITLETLRAFELPLPPLPEQRRIAALLGTWDRAMATVQQLLAAQQKRKQGLMQQLLSGKKRFKGFEGKWKEVRLGELVTKSKGSVVTSTEDPHGTPVIDAGSYEGGATLYSTDRKALRCNESDVLLLWDGSKAGRAMTGKEGIVGSTFVLLKPKAELHPVFLTAMLTHDEQRIMAVREGSGIPHVPKDFLRWYRFLLPPLAEQNAIIRTIRGMEQIEDSLKAELTHLATQKRGLMQVLLTGEVRTNAKTTH